METASVSHDEEHQHAVISFADGAKVQQNSETTKEKRYKKDLPPSSRRTRFVSDALLVKELNRMIHQRQQLILYHSTPSISTAMARSWA